jgi:quercetin dioxygenase-like cupin family protein
MDETFIVKKGTLTIELGDNEQRASLGKVVYVPRFAAHGF